MNKAELLLQRRKHRGNARDYVINSLLNFSQDARFMREFCPFVQKSKMHFRSP
jgi:hypothetical protein